MTQPSKEQGKPSIELSFDTTPRATGGFGLWRAVAMNGEYRYSDSSSKAALGKMLHALKSNGRSSRREDYRIFVVHEDGVKDEIVTIKAKCKPCEASGAYYFNDPHSRHSVEGVGVVCRECNGEGYVYIEYTPFTERSVRTDITRVRLDPRDASTDIEYVLFRGRPRNPDSPRVINASIY